MESNNDTAQYSRHREHRSRRSRTSRHSGLKIWTLSFLLLVAVTALFILSVYTSSRIQELSTRADSVQRQLFLKKKEVDELTASLTQSKDQLEKLVKGRLPSVMRLEPDKVLAVNKDSIKNIVFTKVKHDGSRQYEYKLVLENRSKKIVVPKFRLLVFDKYGVQIGIDQVLTSEELGPGESRSYSSKVDFFVKEDPAYFHVSSMIPAGAKRLQDFLK
jgi:cell division protein FtsB